jgi:hypothetical protein
MTRIGALTGRSSRRCRKVSIVVPFLSDGNSRRDAATRYPVGQGSRNLLERTGHIFRVWRDRLAILLEQGGLPHADAGAFAVVLIAASEGAIVLSRAEQSFDPFDTVHAQLHADIAGRIGLVQTSA